MDTSKVSVVKPNLYTGSTVGVSPVQNINSETNISGKNTSAEETINQIMLDEVLEDVQIFQSQLDDVLELSLKTSKLKVNKIVLFN